MLAKYLKNRGSFSAKIRSIGLNPTEVAEWEAALDAAQHHADLAPARDRDAHPPSSPLPTASPHPPCGQDPSSGTGEGLGGGATAGVPLVRPVPATHGLGRPLYSSSSGGGAVGGGGGGGGHGGAAGGAGEAMTPRKKPGRQPGKTKKLIRTPAAKRARTLDSIVSAAERSNVLQEEAAAAGAEHMRRLQLADAEV